MGCWQLTRSTGAKPPRVDQLARHVEHHGIGREGLMGCTARTAGRFDEPGWATSGVSCASGPGYPARSFTTAGTLSPRRCYRAGSRLQLQPTTWATGRRFSCGPMPTCCRPITTEPVRSSSRPSPAKPCVTRVSVALWDGGYDALTGGVGVKLTGKCFTKRRIGNR